MIADKLEKIIAVGVKVEDSILSQQLSEKNENIYCVVGIHPECASETTDEDIRKIDELASKDKVIGIGEIGLDYHYGADKRNEQIKLFEVGLIQGSSFLFLLGMLYVFAKSRKRLTKNWLQKEKLSLAFVKKQKERKMF